MKVIEQGLRFNPNTKDYVSLPREVQLLMAGKSRLTFECDFVKFDDTNGSIFFLRAAASSNKFSVATTVDRGINVNVRGQVSDTIRQIASINNIFELNTLYKLKVELDIATRNVKVYLNGIKIMDEGFSTVTSPFSNQAYDGVIGCGIPSGVFSQYFDGQISNVKLFANEELVAHYPLNEGNGNIAHDISGYGNHGTIQGATWLIRSVRKKPKDSLLPWSIDKYTKTHTSIQAQNLAQNEILIVNSSNTRRLLYDLQLKPNATYTLRAEMKKADVVSSGNGRNIFIETLDGDRVGGVSVVATHEYQSTLSTFSTTSEINYQLVIYIGSDNSNRDMYIRNLRLDEGTADMPYATVPDLRPAGPKLRPVRTFEPKNLAGLRLWLDASSIDQADNTQVQTWTDKSGWDNNATQATSARRPTFCRNIQNGLPIVRFDGVDDRLVTSLSYLMESFTGFCVYKLTALHQNSFGNITCILGGNYSSGIGSRYNFAVNGSGFIFQVRHGSSAQGITLPYYDNGFNIHKGLSKIDSHAEYVLNGGMVNKIELTGVSNITNGTFSIGSNPTGSTGFYFSGDIAELLIYDRELSIDEITKIQNYLSVKWGIPIES